MPKTNGASYTSNSDRHSELRWAVATCPQQSQPATASLPTAQLLSDVLRNILAFNRGSDAAGDRRHKNNIVLDASRPGIRPFSVAAGPRPVVACGRPDESAA
jgi:hypothetical protein